jgi:SAM-dependent methyltransferase
MMARFARLGADCKQFVCNGCVPAGRRRRHLARRSCIRKDRPATEYGATTVDAKSSGNYPIESREGEIERLHVQAAAMAPDCVRMLDLIGVAPGWHCLDIGCGPGGITDLMAAKANPGGRVVGLDANEGFLVHARARHGAGVEFVHGDAYHAALPAGSFDLVHMRFVASTAGQPERLLAEAQRLARRGGIVALQEPDMATLNCFPPHPAWERLKAALEGAFTVAGADIRLAQRLFALARHSGLADVQYRTFVVGVRSIDPMVDYLPATVESLRGTILGHGLMAEADLAADLAACRAHLRQGDTVFTMYTVAQVWAKTAAP